MNQTLDNKKINMLAILITLEEKEVPNLNFLT